MTEPRSLALPGAEESTTLAQQWRLLSRAATFVAILTSPAVFLYLHKEKGWYVGWAIFASILLIGAFRGFVDLILRRVLPWPSLFGTDDPRLREEDVVNRRRAAFWGFWWKVVRLFLFIVASCLVYRALVHGWDAINPWTQTTAVVHWFIDLGPKVKGFGAYALILPFFFIFNFLILMGPMLLMGITQIHGFEPGDADWGVRLEDVRGQKEAKEEVRRIVSLWQSGQQFEAAGGKRERGLLFLGAPGTGKTMLAKAIATDFNCPFISIPGSGFAQSFMGMDVIIVRYLARKAKKLAAQLGGQCIIFIDEIDAVHHDQQLVQRELAAAAAPEQTTGDALVDDAPQERARRARLRSARREELVTPRARFEDHVAALVERAVRAEEKEILE
jgi:hypothetical protein